MTIRTIMVVLTGLASAPAVLGQSAFDVASVKIDNGPFRPGVSGRMSGGPGTSDPGRFTVTQQRLKFLIASAWDVRLDQISGPAWFDDRSGSAFTITATMPPETAMDQFHLMLQSLLAERFHLTLHHETRSFAGYDLVVAPGGPKLKPWAPDPNFDPKASAVANGPDEQGFPRLRPNQPGNAESVPIGKAGIMRSSHRQSMADFARGLGSSLNMANGAPVGTTSPRVADKTGLTGIYEFKLEFEGTAVMPGLPLLPNAGAPAAASVPSQSGPSIFTALEKQLGLKLVKAKDVPVDILVIDHADKVPVEN